ncbi:hypothetical protein O1L60_12930 [Streptomyces diastatochromogenes]|nr:hypothetical protein [Streptomyces diastatochromogenes]
MAARPSGASARTVWTPGGSPDQSRPPRTAPSSVVTRSRVPGGRSSGGRTSSRPTGPGTGQQALPVGPFGRVEGGGDRLRVPASTPRAPRTATTVASGTGTVTPSEGLWTVATP